MDTTGRAKPGQYLTFHLRGQLYGLPIAVVREINRVGEIAPVPQTHSFVAGVINLRGKIIPVVDLRLKFGFEKIDHTKETCVIVIEGEDGQVGTIVDSVSGVVELEANQIEPTPVMGDPEKLGFVIGMGKVDNKVVILVDAVNALSKAHLAKVVETVTQAA
jgi:purine-binding chemotaxis protein CheW